MNRKVILSLLLVGVLAFGAGIGTFAYFTSSTSSTGNTFTAGRLVITNWNPGNFVAGLNVRNIYPGFISPLHTVEVHNEGTLPLKYKISVNESDSILYTGTYPLQVRIVQGGTAVREWVDIDRMREVELPQSIQPDDPATPDVDEGIGRFEIQYRMPEKAGNDYQGATADLTFVFNATQVENYGTGWNPPTTP